MPTLKLRFPGGRYHATPWGHHVNEGLVEWPPSPWRLLRALIAGGFASQGWAEIPPTARRLIDKLAGVLPSYLLPEATAAHSRHYMPLGKLKSGREETSLVFDTWANVGDGAMFIHWPCPLDDEETALLGQLASALGYLGRSESWVELELLAEDPACPRLGRFLCDDVRAGEEPFADGSACAAWEAFPHRDGHHPGREFEQIALMAAIPADEYQAWHQQVTDTVLAPFPLPEGKKKPPAKLLKDREAAVAPYPPDLIACLTKDTAWWKRQNWSQPPGSRRVLYWRRGEALQVGAPRAPKRRQSGEKKPTTVLLALTTPSGRRSGLPRCERTLPQAELLHRSLISRLGQGQPVPCPMLTGKDEAGKPLRGHRHAHTIPVDLGDDGRLDHILIYAQGGLGDDALRAIRSLRRTWMKGGVGELQVAVVGYGDLEMLRSLPSPFDRGIREFLGPKGGSQVWTTATPLVLPRFLKSQGKNSFLGQINAELASREQPLAESAEIEPRRTREFRHHVRQRRFGRSASPVDVGYGVRLTFAQPVEGPILLGYASHYGLGRFRAQIPDGSAPEEM